MDIGTFGLCTFGFEAQPAARIRESAQELEERGWRALWIPGAALLGPDAFLGVEHAVLFESDPEEISSGSDRIVDDLVFWGDLDTIVEKLHAHVEAGADHVAVRHPDDRGVGGHHPHRPGTGRGRYRPPRGPRHRRPSRRRSP
ncbi:hypothetical protein ABZ725_28430 [Streptomyces sp. NPDC006872]|uniref:hypothetical protein n=1 Tax=Streptomyces sp. NPDC006872 TaxID=3155720 RepID=UPI0033CE3192